MMANEVLLPGPGRYWPLQQRLGLLLRRRAADDQERITPRGSSSHIPLLSVVVSGLSCCQRPARLPAHQLWQAVVNNKSRTQGVGGTDPKVSDDEGQHVAPLPIVLSSCQAPGSR